MRFGSRRVARSRFRGDGGGGCRSSGAGGRGRQCVGLAVDMRDPTMCKSP